MSGEARVPRRGPKPNPDRGSNTGYRLNTRARFELQIAGAFVGTETLQATLDVAVNEFLARLHREAEGFEAAIAAAERHQQRRSGVQRLGDEDKLG